jgi:hypothetical protein
VNWSNTLSAPNPETWLARICREGSFLPTEMGMCDASTSVIGWALWAFVAFLALPLILALFDSPTNPPR